MRFCLISNSVLLTSIALLLLVPTPATNAQDDNQFRRAIESRQESLGSRYDEKQGLQPRFTNETADHIDVFACLTSPSADVDVPAKTSGPLLDVNVLEMQYLQANQLMANIDPEIVQLQVQSAETKLEAAMARAGDDVAIRYAQAAYKVAKKEMEINRDLAIKRSLPEQEYQRSRLAAEQANLQIEKSVHDLEVAKKEARVEEYNLNAAKSSLSRHTIVSPLAGNVIQIFKEPGEWVNEGEKVFRVIKMDKMRVEGLWDISSSMHSPSDVLGKPVTVTVNIGGKPVVFTGKVVMIDLETSGGNRVTVRGEIENRLVDQRWALPAGAEVNMRIHITGSSSTQTANAGGEFIPNQ